MTPQTIHIKNLILAQGFKLSDEAWMDFEGIWDESVLKRKTTISSLGEVERNIYFIIEGVQRVYYFDDKNREATLVFTYPYSFGGVLDSFMLQSPSKYYFETLTPSVMLKTTHAQFQAMVLKHPEFDLFVKSMLNQVIGGLLDRIVELQCFSSEEKFKKLLQRSPHILQLVPHKYLANYLGIDPTNFSKFINSIKV